MTGDNYWKRVIQEVEKSARLNARKEAIKNYDFSVTLPPELRERVAKILPYEFDYYDNHVFMDDQWREVQATSNIDEDTDSNLSQKELKRWKKLNEFNESTCSEIEHMEHEFIKFDLKMDTPVEHKLKAKKKVNWLSTFICKTRKERVKWDSKIYQLEVKMSERTLDEQAEVLMEAAAERFTEWVNSLGNNPETDIPKEKLKALFSIEGERKLLSSIQTEPKEVKAVAKTVADKWNLPEMALELKYENYIRDRLKHVPKKMLTVSFGRTVPHSMRPWIPTAGDDRIKTVFPDEILSGKKLFKGIKHLRTTKALIEFYRKRPNFEKPRFLSTYEKLDAKKQFSGNAEIPLYEKLKLKY